MVYVQAVGLALLGMTMATLAGVFLRLAWTLIKLGPSGVLSIEEDAA